MYWRLRLRPRLSWALCPERPSPQPRKPVLRLRAPPARAPAAVPQAAARVLEQAPGLAQVQRVPAQQQAQAQRPAPLQPPALPVPLLALVWPRRLLQA